MKIKLRKIRVYPSYRREEAFIRWFANYQKYTTYFHCETLEELEVELPDGITYDDEFEKFSDNGNDCTLVNGSDDTVWLVSSKRTVQLI